MNIKTFAALTFAGWLLLLSLALHLHAREIDRLLERQEMLMDKLRGLEQRLEPICWRGDDTASYDPALCREAK